MPSFLLKMEPDAAREGPTCEVVRGLRYTSSGWDSLRRFEPSDAGTIAASRVLDVTQNRLQDRMFAATETGLYARDGNTWSSVSETPLTTASRVKFVNFGPHVIAIAPEWKPQQFNLVGEPTPTNFRDLPGAPRGATGAAVDNFLVLGNIEDGGVWGEGPNMVAWSGFSQPETWEPSPATQSSRRFLSAEGGKIQTILGGKIGIIIREDSIHRMTYIQPPAVFDTNRALAGRGTQAPASPVRVGNTVYWYDQTGFFSLNVDDLSLKAIGEGKVNEWIRSEFRSDQQAVRLTGIVNRVHPEIWWIWPENAGGSFTRGLIYNYLHDTWGEANLVDLHSSGIDWIGNLAKVGLNFDTEPLAGLTQDSLFPGTDRVLGDISMDDPIFAGGAYQWQSVVSVSGNRTLANESGSSNSPSYIKTKEISRAQVKKNVVAAKRVRPDCIIPEGSSVRMRILTRRQPSSRVSIGEWRDWRSGSLWAHTMANGLGYSLAFEAQTPADVSELLQIMWE